MNNQEAKFTLGAFRPGGQDAGDPAFAEAVRRVQDDAELGAWFARARAHDAAVGAKLREIVPPAGLREAILAGSRASRAQPAWWSRPRTWAIAASVAFLLTVVAARFGGIDRLDSRSAAITGFAINDLGVPGHMGVETADGPLKTWLTTSGSKLTAGQSMDFAQLQAHGCRTLGFGGHELAEVCFQREGLVFHLYVVPRDAMPELPARAQPAFIARASRAAAIWSDGKFHYVLATTAGTEALKRLL